jgi:hypothetical protein
VGKARPRPSSSPLERAKTLRRRFSPFIALGIGALTRALSHHGVDFAPKAVALLALAWTLPFALARWTGRAAPASARARTRPSLTQRLAEVASTTLVIALFRNVLFFLVPIWFGSATLSSINIAFPLLLAAMAFFSCFDHAYRTRILERPAARTAWGFVILFAALVPAAAVVASMSPRWAVVISAAIAFVVTGAALLPRERLFKRRSRIRIGAAALAGAIVLTWFAPALPPVPIACHHVAFGTAVRDRALDGAAERFPAATPRLYAWFAVTLPAVYHQGIRFQWFHEGTAAAPPIVSTVVGGRKDGFRTWSYLTAPPPGRWRVDLLTDGDQLICRGSITVGGAR